MDRRHDHLVVAGERGAHRLGGVRLARVVELVAHGARPLRRDGRQLEVRRPVAQRPREHAQRGEIDLHELLDPGHLHLHGDLGRPVAQHGGVDLRERGGGERLRVERGEDLLRLAPELGRHARAPPRVTAGGNTLAVMDDTGTVELSRNWLNAGRVTSHSGGISGTLTQATRSSRARRPASPTRRTTTSRSRPPPRRATRPGRSTPRSRRRTRPRASTCGTRRAGRGRRTGSPTSAPTSTARAPPARPRWTRGRAAAATTAVPAAATRARAAPTAARAQAATATVAAAAAARPAPARSRPRARRSSSASRWRARRCSPDSAATLAAVARR